MDINCGNKNERTFRRSSKLKEIIIQSFNNEYLLKVYDDDPLNLNSLRIRKKNINSSIYVD